MDVFIYLVGALVLLLGSTPTLTGNGKGLPVLVKYLFIVLFTVLGMCSLILISDLVQFLAIELQSFAVYIFDWIISGHLTVSCEGAEDLPRIMEFKDLHLTEGLKEAENTLHGQSGVYCMLCQETGTMYIGSSSNMGERLASHIFNYSSNIHLQRAIALYGLPAFIFIVVEFCNPSDLVAREQHWLNWLFLFPPSFRFNFNRIAYMPPSRLGSTHTLESKKKMSTAFFFLPRFAGWMRSIHLDSFAVKARPLRIVWQKKNSAGENNPSYGKTPSEEARALMSAAQAGENNPSYGLVARNAVGVSIYTKEGELVASFSSQLAAAEYLGITRQAVAKAMKLNHIVKGQYRVSSIK